MVGISSASPQWISMAEYRIAAHEAGGAAGERGQQQRGGERGAQQQRAAAGARQQAQHERGGAHVYRLTQYRMGLTRQAVQPASAASSSAAASVERSSSARRRARGSRRSMSAAVHTCTG
ncbi:unnamed protein product [Euphydryas editha]|uniref:Uncharacterized protein n=1 Tax=Euphydryas editha TaxID=104508 RepID=A0AAU9TH29_EUPED|nr:unnamed protein product [Euphydryas editha]